MKYHFQCIKGNKETPIVQCHGDCDPLVPYKWGQMTASYLKQFATNVDFKTYRGLGHSSSDEVYCFVINILLMYMWLS